MNAQANPDHSTCTPEQCRENCGLRMGACVFPKPIERELGRLRAENEALTKAYERLSTSLGHVINRVSAEHRDDEHGHIFLVGQQALIWADRERSGEGGAA